MAPTSFRQLTIRWSSEPGVTVAHLRGHVDAGAAEDLGAVAVVADSAPRVVLDLVDVHFVDIAGLDLLEELARRPNVAVRSQSAAITRVLARTDGIVEDWAALREWS